MTRDQEETWERATKPARLSLLKLIRSCDPLLAFSPTSQASLEAEQGKAFAGPEGVWGPNPVASSFGYAGMSLGAALDFAQGFAAVVETQHKIALSPSVLTRAAGESAMRAFWLFDPQIGGRERVERYMNARIADLRETFRLKEFAPDYVEHSRTQVQGILAAGEKLGFAKSLNKDPRGLGALPPSPAKIMAALLGPRDKGFSAALFASLSSVTHGNASGVMQFAAQVDQSEDYLNPRALIALSWQEVWRKAMAIGWTITRAYEAHQKLFKIRASGWPTAKVQFERVITSRDLSEVQGSRPVTR